MITNGNDEKRFWCSVGRSGSTSLASKSRRTAASTDICDVSADACEETDVRAEVVLSAGGGPRVG